MRSCAMCIRMNCFYMVETSFDYAIWCMLSIKMAGASQARVDLHLSKKCDTFTSLVDFGTNAFSCLPFVYEVPCWEKAWTSSPLGMCCHYWARPRPRKPLHGPSCQGKPRKMVPCHCITSHYLAPKCGMAKACMILICRLISIDVVLGLWDFCFVALHFCICTFIVV